MFIHLRNLFWHHHHNNHKPRTLHLSSLTFFITLVLVFQTSLTLFNNLKPGVLGFAAHITNDEIVSLTNQQRAIAGLAPLRVNPLLVQAAVAKANFMFAKNFWAHKAPDGTSPWFFFHQVGYNYRYAGENLARDFNDSISVVNAWMNSSTHRDNLLSNRYDEIGVAVVNGVLGGQETTLIVQLFGQETETLAAVSETAIQTNQTNESGLISKPEIAMAETIDVSLNQIEGSYIEKLPLLSGFTLTKSLNLALILLIMIVLAIDGWLVWHRQTIRISGKSFIHLSFFALVALIILLSGSGQIL